MGRKIEIKRIENTTRRQVTYSKRRSSLIKKANEISVFCDIDVLLLAFSHSGRVNTFCSRERIGDVLERYMNLPTTSRYPIKHLEEQIKTKKSEIGILHHKLKGFEPDEENVSLSQVLSLEEHFKNSLKLVKNRKKFLIGNHSSSPSTELTSENDNDQNIEEAETIIRRGPRDHQHDQLQTVLQNIEENQLIYELQNPTSSQIVLQLDPWLNNDAAPHRWSRARDLVAQEEVTFAGNEVHGVSNNSTDSLPAVTTGFSSNTVQYSNWFTPQTKISSNYGLNIKVNPSAESTTGVAPPMSHYDAITTNDQLNWFPSSDYNNIAAPLPSSSAGARINATGSSEPCFMTNVDAANYIPTTINGNEISENNNGSNISTIDQVIPVAESSAQAETRNNNNMCTTAAGNQAAVDGFSCWDLDDSILLQNLNFRDLDIIFD
ncbi:agamous-like MADS-box protein AGL30 [Tripterygium wilfordii]|uniref:agamous-like MADS-box protein AGL30 n=1 Tax=Tripterygium wilfordii TaxID=458696 RepID=UPI0018F86310|nr:agamous-like MADS-box protein AGL30 [Tripterygium wilfordii]